MQQSGFKDLKVWQKGTDLVDAIYSITAQLPQKEQYALSSQMTRAGISIPSNIAEGWGRQSKPEFARFLCIAFGSACELETQLLISKKQYSNISYDSAFSLLEEVKKMTLPLIKYQREKT